MESSRRDLHNALLCTVLESTIENWGKKNLAKTTPKRRENKKTGQEELISSRNPLLSTTSARALKSVLSNLNNSAKCRQRCWRVQHRNDKQFFIFQISSRFSLMLTKFARIFSEFRENAEKRCNGQCNLPTFRKFSISIEFSS